MSPPRLPGQRKPQSVGVSEPTPTWTEGLLRSVGAAVPRPEPNRVLLGARFTHGGAHLTGAWDAPPVGCGESRTPFLLMKAFRDFPRQPGSGRKTDSLTFPSRIPRRERPGLCSQERLFGLAGPRRSLSSTWVTNGAAWGQGLRGPGGEGVLGATGPGTQTAWVQPPSPGSPHTSCDFFRRAAMAEGDRRELR